MNSVRFITLAVFSALLLLPSCGTRKTTITSDFSEKTINAQISSDSSALTSNADKVITDSTEEIRLRWEYAPPDSTGKRYVRTFSIEKRRTRHKSRKKSVSTQHTITRTDSLALTSTNNKTKNTDVTDKNYGIKPLILILIIITTFFLYDKFTHK